MTDRSAAVEPASGVAEARRDRRGLSLTALGGIAAQCSQAGASFLLQILAVRLLGLEGLGVFATLYGIVIVATGVATGFIGDSLTVLDRTAARTRAALQLWWVGLSVGLGVLAGLAGLLTGLVDGVTALVFGIATGLFLLEDALRRLLMANLRFWRLVVVDLSGFLGALAVIAVQLATSGSIAVVHLILALAVGQTVATIVAISMLPTTERHLAPWRPADLRAVWSYGLNRAVQLSLRPGLQAATRLIGLALISAAAVGELEAARVYMAPAMIIVGGLVSVLFAQYARSKRVALIRQVRTADRHALALALGCLLLSAAAYLAVPWFGPLLTDGSYELATVGLLGWAVRAVAYAAAMPYMSLAAVRGLHRATLRITAAEFVVVLVALVLVLTLGGSILWIPFLLAAGSLVSALIVRLVLLPRSAAGAETESVTVEDRTTTEGSAR